MASAERAREYYWENREQVLAKKAAAYSESVRERSKEWQRNHPDKVKMYKRNTYAKRKAAEGRYGVKDIEYLLRVQDGRCYYCDSDISEAYEVDHWVPLSRGGTNYPDNLVLACHPCNSGKRAKLPIEFMSGVI